MKKRILALLLAGAMTLSMVACSNNAEQPENTDKTPGTSNTSNPGTPSDKTDEPAFEGVRELVVGLPGDIKTWDPWGSFSTGVQNMRSLVFQTLTIRLPDQVNGGSDLYYVLAESVENPSKNVYVVKLRDGIVDSAGNPFTAEDAMFSLQGYKDQWGGDQCAIIDSMEEIDELTFKVNAVPSLDTIGAFEDMCNAICMVTKEAYEASPDKMATAPVGTGPWVLGEHASGSYYTFQKADSFWNAAANESKDPAAGYCSMWDDTNLDVLRYEIITDTATMAIALESGEIDIAREIGIEDKALFESNDDFAVFGAPDASQTVAFNVSKNSPFENYNLRMAVAHAIDAETCLMAAVDGDGEVAKAWGHPLFKDYQQAWNDRDNFGFDLAKAKDYLAKWEKETGKKAADLHLVLLYQNGDLDAATCLAIQSNIGQLTGNPNTVEIKGLDRGTVKEARANATEFDMYLMNGQVVTRSTCSYEWVSYCSNSRSGYNIFHTDDTQLEQLMLNAINLETTSDKAFQEFHDYIDDNCMAKSLFFANAYGAAASWIGDLEWSVGGKNHLNVGAFTYDWNASGK